MCLECIKIVSRDEKVQDILIIWRVKSCVCLMCVKICQQFITIYFINNAWISKQVGLKNDGYKQRIKPLARGDSLQVILEYSVSACTQHDLLWQWFVIVVRMGHICDLIYFYPHHFNVSVSRSILMNAVSHIHRLTSEATDFGGPCCINLYINEETLILLKLL